MQTVIIKILGQFFSFKLAHEKEIKVFIRMTIE